MVILIVDDEKRARLDLRRLIKGILPHAEIDEAEGWKGCLALVADKCYDIVFLDINMPEMDGLTLAEEIKKYQPLINIIILTAYPEYAFDAHQLFVSGYLLKPALPEDLRRVLSNL
ncbi:LytR/AlgR family response regulator transcription factor [Butyrivibrio sp. MC2013]|uniref:LytR/AlgR family response regulator transcription factor n=1 Tax=Butyrivibrio sp. MC2013 TaxID=1280686 RepID=UPI0004291549|nr:response regulator [Butyrivibrio sp. MC2013]